MGTTDARGGFVLGTFAQADGAMVGEHAVCISKSIVDPDAKADSPYKKSKSLLPAVYGTPVTSPLKAKVVARGPNEFRFELSD
ncbi:MAG: hypothetical protein ACKO40_01740 [Planctomycetaceae bacterium]